jgi:hypothetical protein
MKVPCLARLSSIQTPNWMGLTIAINSIALLLTGCLLLAAGHGVVALLLVLGGVVALPAQARLQSRGQATPAAIVSVVSAWAIVACAFAWLGLGITSILAGTCALAVTGLNGWRLLRARRAVQTGCDRCDTCSMGVTCAQCPTLAASIRPACCTSKASNDPGKAIKTPPPLAPLSTLLSPARPVAIPQATRFEQVAIATAV